MGCPGGTDAHGQERFQLLEVEIWQQQFCLLAPVCAAIKFEGSIAKDEAERYAQHKVQEENFGQS